MEQIVLIILFFFLLLLGIFHIFEEIAMKAHEIIPSVSLTKYLIVASVIVSVQTTAFLGIALDMLFGYILGIVVAVFAILNGIVHTVGYLKVGKEKKLSGTLAAGFYTGLLLLVFGTIILVFLSLHLAGL